MLRNHRRTFVHALALLGAMGLIFYAVGRHPPAAAPMTTVDVVGDIDLTVYHAMDDIRNLLLTGLARVLNFLGAGLVTIPLRMLVAGYLALRRRWRAFAVWVLTWGMAEVLVEIAKDFFHRGRPFDPLVQIVGYSRSFPSGHAVAGASIAVALVLVSFPAGAERRRWEWLAVAFSFVMAFSRVYLRAHWLSDVVAGVLLGTGVALGVAATVTEIRHHVLGRWWPKPEPVDETVGR